MYIFIYIHNQAKLKKFSFTNPTYTLIDTVSNVLQTHEFITMEIISVQNTYLYGEEINHDFSQFLHRDTWLNIVLECKQNFSERN